MWWNYMKRGLTPALALAGLSWVLFNLILIAIKGPVIIHESNAPILYTEIVLTALACVFVAGRVIGDIIALTLRSPEDKGGRQLH